MNISFNQFFPDLIIDDCKICYKAKITIKLLRIFQKFKKIREWTTEFYFCIKKPTMDKRTRSILKTIAILLVLVAVLVDLDVLVLNAIEPYKFWMTVLGFGVLLLASR